MKLSFALICLLLITTYNSRTIICSDYIQEFFEVEEVFILPDINTASQKIKYEYFNDKLFVLNNDFVFKKDSIQLDFFISETNEDYLITNLVFPKLNLHERIFITDLIVTDSSLYLLEFNNLIIFKRLNNSFLYTKTIPLELSCSNIYKLNNESIFLASSLVSGDHIKFKKINFLYLINLKNESHEIKEFEHPKFYSLINVGPRNNKVFLDDSTIIYSDIISYKLNIENNSKVNQIKISKDKWKEDDSILSQIKTENVNPKTSFIEYYNYHNEHSSILNLFKIEDRLIVQYKYNLQEDRKKHFDIFEIGKDHKISLLYDDLVNYDIDSLENFNIQYFNFSNNIKIRDNVMLELSKFPFNKSKLFKNNVEFLKEREDFLIENGLRYSIIVRRLK